MVLPSWNFETDRPKIIDSEPEIDPGRARRLVSQQVADLLERNRSPQQTCRPREPESMSTVPALYCNAGLLQSISDDRNHAAT